MLTLNTDRTKQPNKCCISPQHRKTLYHNYLLPPSSFLLPSSSFLLPSSSFLLPSSFVFLTFIKIFKSHFDLGRQDSCFFFTAPTMGIIRDGNRRTDRNFYLRTPSRNAGAIADTHRYNFHPQTRFAQLCLNCQTSQSRLNRVNFAILINVAFGKNHQHLLVEEKFHPVTETANCWMPDIHRKPSQMSDEPTLQSFHFISSCHKPQIASSHHLSR